MRGLDRRAVAEKVIAQLRIASISKTKVTEYSEIYYDLGIYRDVLAFEVFIWMIDEFGVVIDPPVDIEEFAPGERP